MKTSAGSLLLAALALFWLARPAAAEVTWLRDYSEAYAAAQAQRKMLLIYFEDEAPTAADMEFDEVTLADAVVQSRLADYVLVRVSTSAEIVIAGEPVKLLEHGGFAAMRKQAGLAVIDLTHTSEQHYGQTVTCLPFEPPAYFAPQYHSTRSLSVLLNLPAGSLTQRTVVYAVRCHPELPACTSGRADEILLAAAASHSRHQASITTQGHHGWNTRFQELHAQLGGAPPTEVCAQSWPGESLVEACFSAVDSWRQSPGHWSAIRARQPAYGLDIRRGRDGNWYATGIFGGRSS